MKSQQKPKTLAKAATGIEGLDDITEGGFPQGRPTLVCGTAGCGKSLMGIEFLVHGATDFNEPGVLMTFEESAEDIKKNVASLGFDLDDLVKRKKLHIDYVHIERNSIEENGEYDLEGLFVRLDYAIKAIGAKRVMLDTIENLFSGLSNPGILRAVIRRRVRTRLGRNRRGPALRPAPLRHRLHASLHRRHHQYPQTLRRAPQRALRP